ncbi:hypothetical protein GCM10020001_079170 [Nonomuraea salmonea]
MTERVSARGEVLTPLDPDSVRRVAAEIAGRGIESVAVCFLHSYANPAHERQAAAILRESVKNVVVSSEVWPEIREYERATTTIVSAYVGPLMAAYLSRLRERLAGIGIHAPVHVMESGGGVLSAELAARRAVATIESGPAAGVLAAAGAGFADAISFDMGGTTAKTCVIRGGRPEITHEFHVGGKGSFGGRRAGTGVPIKTPAIDLAEVGAGGGSVAWLDPAGALRVGPRSAGSSPAPPATAWAGTSRPSRTRTSSSATCRRPPSRSPPASPGPPWTGSPGRSGCRGRRRRTPCTRSSAPPWRRRCTWSPCSGASTRAGSRWSPSAGPGPCTRRGWRSGSGSRPWWCRRTAGWPRRPGCSRARCRPTGC